MMNTPHASTAAWLLASLLCAAAPATGAAPFTLDKETLLLADFEGDPYRAAYANGWESFSGSDAKLVPGYYGTAIDLTGRSPHAVGELPDKMAQWAFWPKANVTYDEGTVEFWFRADMKTETPPLFTDSAFFFYSYQPLRPTGVDPADTQGQKIVEGQGGVRTQPVLRINNYRLAYKLVTVSGKVLEGNIPFPKVPGFKKKLAPDEWHHFALTWADGELAFYLDGVKLATHDITGEHGLAFASTTQRPVAMSGIVLDELRLSSVARYRANFEPNWRDEKRPDYAFRSEESFPEIATRYRAPIQPAPLEVAAAKARRTVAAGPLTLAFDEKTGALLSASFEGEEAASPLTEGLRLFSDIARTPLKSTKASRWAVSKEGVTTFRQRFEGGVTARHTITPGDPAAMWTIVLQNDSKKEVKLEALLGLPAPFPKVEEFFDSSAVQTKLPLPRRRDEYIFSLPFVAASGGGKGFGFGVDPQTDLSSLIAEWVPASGTEERPAIRQGTRLVLAPGERFTLAYRLLGETANRDGSLAVLDNFHALFPLLYRQRADVPIHSYMPVAQHFKYVRLPDLARQLYIGNQWGHGPYHTKGDYMGSAKYWGNPQYMNRADFQHGLRNQKRYGTIENLHKEIVKTSKASFDYYYSLRRSHDLPNMTPRYIVEDVWPAFVDKDDPLVAGQYYLPSAIFVNERQTPLGEKFIKDQRDLMQLIGRYSPGLINDMCQISPYRFIDEAAQATPGRAFSADRGVYTLSAFGHTQRYRTINDFTTEGYRQSMWSDFGMVSYSLAAHSSALAFEAGERFWGITCFGPAFTNSRYLAGEKPTITLVSYGADQLGQHYKPEEFTPPVLREFYRQKLHDVFLYAMERGLYLDPPYLHGYHQMFENNAVLVESILHGRRLLPGGVAGERLWVVRGGSGWDSLWVLGNTTETQQAAALSLYRDSFSSPAGAMAAPIVVPYFGGSVEQVIGKEGTRLAEGESAIPARDFAAFKAVASLAPAQGKEATGEPRVKSTLTGDGLTMKLVLEVDAPYPTTLAVNPFAPLYKWAECTLDGKPLALTAGEASEIPAGRHVVTITYENTIARFSGEAWAKASLIADGKTNFCIIGEKRVGFDHGTATQLNFFLQQYDEEDGVVGNLDDAPIYTTAAEVPADYPGWKIQLIKGQGPTALTMAGEEREITLRGATSGELRKAMVVLTRLLDRKYPHIGRPYPLREVSREWESEEQPNFVKQKIKPATKTPAPPFKLLKTPATETFFTNFSDPEFIRKPILPAALETLYGEGNNDFAGRYPLRHSPWIFEPTFASNYVYGYDETLSTD